MPKLLNETALYAIATFVNERIAAAISTVYRPQGSASVTQLNNAIKEVSKNGYVYNVTDSGTLVNSDSSTLTVLAGDNVVLIWNNGAWYWDKLAGTVDLTPFARLASANNFTATTNTFKNIVISENYSISVSDLINVRKIWRTNKTGNPDIELLENSVKFYKSLTDGTYTISIQEIYNKVTSNPSITPGTKCKISYDAKGLVTAGTDLEASDIPGLDASKIVSGVLADARIPGLNANKITEGSFPDARIQSATAWNNKYDKPLTGIPGADLASGYGEVSNPYTAKQANYILAGPDGSPGHTVDAVPSFRLLVPSDIPVLDASKITTGVFNINRIPDLSSLYINLAGEQTVIGVKYFKANNSQAANIIMDIDSTTLEKHTIIKVGGGNVLNIEALVNSTDFGKDVNFNGLIFAGGKELRFGGDNDESHLNITDNTDDHNTILYLDKDSISAEKVVYLQEGAYSSVYPTEDNHVARKDYVDNVTDELDERKLELHPFDKFVNGSQVHDQMSNGELAYCQSGSQTSIDPSGGSPTIQITLDQTHASTSSRKALYIKQIIITYETDAEPGVLKTWNYTIEESLFHTISSNTDYEPKTVTLTDPVSEVSLDWVLLYTVTSGKNYYFGYDGTKGQQFGSGSQNVQTIVLETTSLQNCTVKDIKVYTSGASGTSAKASIMLAGEDQWYVIDAEEQEIEYPTITTSNTEYDFIYGENGTHLGSGGTVTVTYEHVFLKKRVDGSVYTIEANSDYLYILANEYRLYKYINDSMEEVSKTRLGTTSDTAYRGDYGQDNYNQINAIKNQNTTFNGNKTFTNPISVTAGLKRRNTDDDDDILFVFDPDLDASVQHTIATEGWVTEQGYLTSVPDLPASKITSGEFDTARIPSLDASKITSGTFDTARLPDSYGDTKNPYGTKAKNKVLAGPDGSSGHTADAVPTFRALVAADIPSLNASKIAYGTFDINRIPYMPMWKISDLIDNYELGSDEDLSDTFWDDPEAFRAVWHYYHGTHYGHCWYLAAPYKFGSGATIYSIAIGDSGFTVDDQLGSDIGYDSSNIMKVNSNGCIYKNYSLENGHTVTVRISKNKLYDGHYARLQYEYWLSDGTHNTVNTGYVESYSITLTHVVLIKIIDISYSNVDTTKVSLDGGEAFYCPYTNTVGEILSMSWNRWCQPLTDTWFTVDLEYA